MRFSANLGLLFTEFALPAAVEQAARAGFQAVECHWPYDTDPGLLQAALDRTGLPLLGLNTIRGNPAAGETGLAALPGRQAEARAAIKQAIDYGHRLGAANLHVMAGLASGQAAEDTFAENLRFASDAAGKAGMTILIEPLNRHDVPGYFLTNGDQAGDLLARLDRPNIKIMFDCYHLQQQQGDLIHLFLRLQPLIGHIQFAAVPDRGPPDHGELDYRWLLAEFARLGYEGYFGAEYICAGPSADNLGWMAGFAGQPG